MSTSNLVDVIAEALFDADLGHMPRDYYAHQARAVLAAVEAAGNVEWGLFRKDDPLDRLTPLEGARFKTEADAKKHLKFSFIPAFQEIIEPRSRVTGPWTRAE